MFFKNITFSSNICLRSLTRSNYFLYYKTQRSSSRLRYQGSYLPPITKSFKHNGQLSPKKEEIKSEERDEEDSELSQTYLHCSNFKYCFEKVPSNSAWYKTFQRVDRGEQRYRFFNDCK